MRVQLRDLCATRAGDKGDIANVALFAYDEPTYEAVRDQVTADRVKAHFGGLVHGRVRRYEAPNVLGLNFVLEAALGGGGPRSLRSDSLGKTLGGALLRLEVEVPDGTALRPRPPVPRRGEPWRPLPPS
ncbi:MAG: AtuA-related protein [Acidimicrobiales bacterium]